MCNIVHGNFRRSFFTLRNQDATAARSETLQSSRSRRRKWRAVETIDENSSRRLFRTRRATRFLSVQTRAPPFSVQRRRGCLCVTLLRRTSVATAASFEIEVKNVSTLHGNIGMATFFSFFFRFLACCASSSVSRPPSHPSSRNSSCSRGYDAMSGAIRRWRELAR